MGNEQELFRKRMIDLSKQADRKGIAIYSDFLNLNEQNILCALLDTLETSCELLGGHPYAERKIAGFFPAEEIWEAAPPLSCLQIVPSYPKFADALTHRDVLGAVMSLGLDRAKFGDILKKEERFYLFCKDSVKEYLCDSLVQIRHTQVTLEETALGEMEILPEFVEKSGIISSNRLDNLIACICGCSRNEASRLITEGKVFVDGREILSKTYVCQEGKTLSVRSYGKYIFDSCSGETRKGRIKIKYRIYS